MNRLARRWPMVLAAVVVGTGLMAMGAAPVQAKTTGPEAQSNYCVVVLDKAPSAHAASPEIYRHCSARPFDAAAQVKSAEARQAGVSPASSTHLFRAYEDNNFQGQWWDYYGDAGPCDTAGYHWNLSDWWSKHLSSIEKGYNSNCNYATLWSNYNNWTTTYELSQSYLDSYWNDNTYQLQVYK